MHISTQSLIAAGVLAHLLLDVAHFLCKRPQDQVKIDALGQKADGILAEVQAVATVVNGTKGGR